MKVLWGKRAASCCCSLPVLPCEAHPRGSLISCSSCQRRGNTKRRWRCLKRPWNWSQPPRWDYVGGPGRRHHHPCQPASKSLVHTQSEGHSKIKTPLQVKHTPGKNSKQPKILTCLSTGAMSCMMLLCSWGQWSCVSKSFSVILCQWLLLITK